MQGVIFTDFSNRCKNRQKKKLALAQAALIWSLWKIHDLPARWGTSGTVILFMTASIVSNLEGFSPPFTLFAVGLTGGLILEGGSLFRSKKVIT